MSKRLEHKLDTLIALFSEKVLQSTTQKGGFETMPRPLQYGQGSIKERTRTNKKGGIHTWYEVRWYDEYGKRHTKTSTTTPISTPIRN